MDSQFLGLKRFLKVLRLSFKFIFKVRLSDVNRESLFNLFSAQLEQQACFQKVLCSRRVVMSNEVRKRQGGKTKF